jgi:hypothetical protein
LDLSVLEQNHELLEDKIGHRLNHSGVKTILAAKEKSKEDRFEELRKHRSFIQRIPHPPPDPHPSENQYPVAAEGFYTPPIRRHKVDEKNTKGKLLCCLKVEISPGVYKMLHVHEVRVFVLIKIKFF